ncbi:CobW family GTP-binding protein [Sneathiella sp. HT1-7]|uniref:CobW family GTP-binding protein n=1 Tax=Sneathiella sp. HT1-7 TaxID=2887192 RepID=UPI001D14E0D9|nr:GTP-binding protein [Sneathiella sp. HT1-7]MCC3306424.1 GTP-binding protein [Sneathiella sp. HT1-7]
MNGRIPIILISGYLGAGKTTLINHLLAADHGRRIAVLVNDFGAINIDAALISDQTENTISLTNGCVCCSITDDLGTALDALTLREELPDLVVLEASGVAEPSRLARHAGNWPGFELDAIITLLDAETVQLRAVNKFVGQLVKSQIEAADLLVLTKADLVSNETCEKLAGWIETLAPGVSVIMAEAGKVAPELIVGLPARSNLSQTMKEEPHEDNFSTSHWTPPGPIRKDNLIRKLEELPSSIHRVKGFFVDADTGEAVLLQRVGSRFSFEDAPTKAEVGFVMISAGSPDELERGMKILSSIVDVSPLHGPSVVHFN